MTNKLSPEEIAEMSEDCQCSCKELEQLRSAISLAHAAVKTAQELAATRLGEIERLQKRLDRIDDKWPHVTEAEQLREVIARCYMRLQCADVPREPWHWEVCTTLDNTGAPSLHAEPLPSRTDHAENLAKALEHYLKTHDTLSAVQDTDEVSGTNEASDCGLHDAANDAWRAMRTALHEYRKHAQKSGESR